MTNEPSRLAVGAIVRRGSDILLVAEQGPDQQGADERGPDAQGLDAQGPDAQGPDKQGPGGERPVWALPGGVVEPGETVHDALLRDVRVDTGIEVCPGPLLWVARYELAGATWQSYGFAAFAEDGANPRGRSAWVPFVDAVDRLADMWFAPIREPAVQHLVGRAPAATLWTWASLDAAPDVVPQLA